MSTILAHLQVKPGCEAEFERIAAELYRGTHATESRVARYEYWRGEVPGSYYTLLSFESEDGFLEHQTSDHHETEGPKLGPIMESLRLEWVDPIAESSPLALTNRSPLRPDATELWTLYHERYAAKVQAWWQPLRNLNS